uniref:CBU_0592 family membrane protein n=1 Tax=uncultured Sphingomonas sp. TaxID=158754 RepID=UPI0035CBE383
MSLLIEAIGWAAALLILASYLLVSSGRLSGQSATFQWMNVVAAAGFVLNSGAHGAWPSTTLNVAWAGIGLFTLWRIWRKSPAS